MTEHEYVHYKKIMTVINQELAQLGPAEAVVYLTSEIAKVKTQLAVALGRQTWVESLDDEITLDINLKRKDRHETRTSKA